ncbi:MAG TPA: hypothetical protein VH298_12115 [Jatrophihabitans sp.]|jgi:hypothetical protein|nr:hypothetical protein [Jatrophihabitans sp.]
MTGDDARRDIEVRLEQALDEMATATVPAGRPRPPYPYPVELDRPAPPPRHPRLHRRWAGPLLVAAVLLIVTLGVSQLPALSSHRHQPATAVPSTSVPTPQPSVSTTAPAPTRPAPSPSRTRSSVPPTAVDPRTIDLANAVIDIPSSQQTDCQPAGRQQFHNGVSKPRYFQWQLDQRLRYANLDGQPGDEVLATITCADSEITPSFLVVLKVAPDRSLRTLGLLNLAGDQLLVYDRDTIQIEGNAVLVEVMGPTHGPGYGPLANKQVRGYGYSGGRFVQVSGPTSFPPLPKTVVGVDLANTTLLIGPGCSGCGDAWVRFVNGTGQAALVPDGPLSTFTQGPASLAKDAAGQVIGIMTIRWTSPDGPGRSAAFQIMNNGGISPLQLVAIALSGRDGILTVLSAHGTPGSDVVTVVVNTTQGNQTRKYQAPQYYGQPWKRLS